MVIVHDDDLGRIRGIGDDTSLETLHGGVVKDYLRSLKPEIQQVLYDRTSSDESGPNTDTTAIRVAMFSNESQENNGSSPRPLAEPSLAVTPHTPNINDPSVLAIPTPLQTSQASPHIPPLPAFSMQGRPSEGGSSLSDSALLIDLGQLPPGPLAPDTPLPEAISVQPLGQDRQTESQPFFQDIYYVGAPPQNVPISYENIGCTYR